LWFNLCFSFGRKEFFLSPLCLHGPDEISIPFNSSQFVSFQFYVVNILPRHTSILEISYAILLFCSAEADGGGGDVAG
jgi:hypothetical protein